MSRTTRVRIVSQQLQHALTRPQAVMACDVRTLQGAAATIAAGATLSTTQLTALTAARATIGGTVPAGMLSTGPAPASLSAPDRERLAKSVNAMADAAAVQQRNMLTSTVRNTLEAADWKVTVVEGREPNRYTGIEATRGDEHLIAAVGPGELVADQSGAHDCGATVDLLTVGLEKAGLAATVTDDVPHDGAGGSLYALARAGGPTLAEAVQASLRFGAGQPAAVKRRSAPPPLRATAG